MGEELLEALLKRAHVEGALLGRARGAVYSSQVLGRGGHYAGVVQSDVAELGRRGGGRRVVSVIEALRYGEGFLLVEVGQGPHVRGDATEQTIH